MESRESWERRWQLAKQRTDAKIIELHQISGNVQVKMSIFAPKKFGKMKSEIGTPKIDAFSSFEHYQNASIFGEGLYYILNTNVSSEVLLFGRHSK